MNSVSSKNNAAEFIPLAPQFCDRVTSEEMERNTKEKTKLELAKLSNTINGINPSLSRVPSQKTASQKEENSTTRYECKDPEKEVFMMLIQCLDRLQSMTAQQCNLSEKYSLVAEEALKHKKELDEKTKTYEKELDQITEEKNHFETLCEEYENSAKREKNKYVLVVKGKNWSINCYKWLFMIVTVFYVALLLFTFECPEQSISSYNQAKTNLFSYFH